MGKALALCAVLLLLLPSTVRAEWHFTPMVGLTMLGSTTILDPQLATDKRHGNFGGAVSFLTDGWLGAEVISIWTPGFFENDGPTSELEPTLPVRIDSSRTVSLMANVVLTTPRRWTEYFLRPYVSGGLGLMHIHLKEPLDFFSVNFNRAGFNVGGGAVGFLTQRTGLRFDVRYHSTLRETDPGDIALGPIRMRYVTATIGLVFRR
jgi:hypothetical protein